jgi:hypothetical protein
MYRRKQVFEAVLKAWEEMSQTATEENKKRVQLIEPSFISWELTGSNRRPSACKADALNQLS